jgi:cell division septation protein DedD
LAQDGDCYHFELNNKQLIFYFLAGAAGLTLAFLGGVWLGRGVDAGAVETRVVREEPVVATTGTEEAQPSPTAVKTAQLTYTQRLDGERGRETLDGPKPIGATPGVVAKVTPSPAVGPKSAPPVLAVSPDRAAATPAATPARVSPVTAKPTAAVKPTPSAKAKPSPSVAVSSTRPGAVAASGALTLQVGAFKDKGSADTVMSRLKAKGFPAYVVSPAETRGGLFNVRVGAYKSRAEAEQVRARLENQERFKPFIVHQ